MGLFAIGMRCLLLVCVIGRSRDPLPPQVITALSFGELLTSYPPYVLSSSLKRPPASSMVSRGSTPFTSTSTLAPSWRRIPGNGDRPILNSSHSTFTSTAFTHCRFWRYHLTVCSRPSSQVVCGDHPKSRAALERSAQVAGTPAGG